MQGHHGAGEGLSGEHDGLRARFRGGCVSWSSSWRADADADNTCRDVTKRYAKKYSSVTKKARLPTRSGYDDWFDSLIQPYMRSFRLVSLPCS